MFDILDELSKTEKMYDNNLEQSQELEKKNIRLSSEMCLNIKKSKSEILKQINENEEYLKLMPNISVMLDDILNQISNDEINDISGAKLVIRILNEIEEHNQNVEKKQKRQVDNDKMYMDSRGIFDKIVSAVKEEIQNDN